MVAQATPNIEMSNIATFGAVAAGAFGWQGRSGMTEKRHVGSNRFSDIPVSGEVAEPSGTGKDHSIVVGHLKTQISPAADTDPGG